MKTNIFKACVIKAGLAASTLLFVGGVALAQQQVNLSAGPTTAVLPDGQSVPMWGYSCGAVVTGSTATCAALNPSAGSNWSPIVITIPAGAMGGLQINLTNNLSFTGGAVPTSMVIVGQLGGGLGLPPARMPSPIHAPQGATWPGTLGPVSALVSTITVTNGGSGYYGTAPTVTVSDPGGTGTTATATATIANGTVTAINLATNGGGSGYTAEPTVTISNPPPGTTATATATIDTTSGTVTAINLATNGGGSGYTTAPSVTISAPDTTGTTATATATVDPATGTVTGFTVTNAGSGYTATPTVTISDPVTTTAMARANLASAQSSDAPTFVGPAQVDRVRSMATEVSVSDTGGKQLTWTNLRPGTYLIESGTEPSIQVPMGLYGVVVVTDDVNNVYPYANSASFPTDASGNTSTVPFDSAVTMLLSEIDPVQNREVAAVVQNPKFGNPLTATYVWNGGKGACGDVSVSSDQHWCYPPAINYTPLYYLVNGQSYDRTNPSASALSVPATTGAATPAGVLMRIVNAGLRVHVPSVVGATVSLVAEDGFTLPGVPKQQNEIVMPAGKTADAIIHPTQTTAGTYDNATLPVFDRTLDLSTNNQHDGGMQASIQIGSGGTAAVAVAATANPDTYAENTTGSGSGLTGSITISDPTKGVLANDVGIYGVQAVPPVAGLTLNPNGTFTYSGPPATGSATTFTYCGNGATSGTACANVTIKNCATTAACRSGNPTANSDSYTSNVATRLQVSPPGVLANDTDPGGLPLTAAILASPSVVGGSVTLNSDGSFVVTPTTPPAPGSTATVTFNYMATNSQGGHSNAGRVSVVFNGGSGLAVNVKDAVNGAPIGDYRWIIEEDKTFYVDPKCQVNSTDPALRPTSCPPLPVESLAYSFHTSNMPVVAQGCVGSVSCESGQTVFDPTTGTHLPAVCDVGDGSCRTDGTQETQVLPSAVYLDPTKRYYISILPGDAANPTIGGSGGPVDDGHGGQRKFDIAKDCGAYDPTADAWFPGGNSATGNPPLCGHGMGGASIAAGQTAVDVSLQEQPLPTAKISVFVFQDDNPLNGENDAGGGVDVIAPNEAGLGGFNLILYDQGGMLGDATGQITYDQFNEPVTNALAGKIDPITGLDACPLTKPADAIVGTIPTCPKYESDGTTESPLAGQAIIDNLYPGLYEVVATPAAARIARGEEWLQTSTLDGTKPIEAFLKPGEPGYFQEFGPGGYHVMIGFANPQIINDRRHNDAGTGMCDGTSSGGGGLTCDGVLNVQVTSTRMSRTPDQRLYSSGTYDAYSFTQCYISIGLPDAEDFAFAKCSPDGKVQFTGLPEGDFKLTVFDQWNDIMLDGLVSPVHVAAPSTDPTTGAVLPTPYTEFPTTQWRTDLYTRTFIDQNGDGISQDSEPGLNQVNTNLRYRDGSIGFFNNTDMNGYAAYNEVFPFMDWLVAETSSTRYKSTGEHVVYDGGGMADDTTLPDATTCSGTTTPPCGTSTIAAHLAGTVEQNSVPSNLRVPGAVYCDNADCTGFSIATPQSATDYDALSAHSTGRIDPPLPWGFPTEGWQGMLGQNSFIEFGMKPYAAGENGGIKGQVIYASTRPFDDPALELQLSWEPGIPHVKVNLYQETVDANGNQHLKLVDTTTTASWDDWAQGFRSDGVPNMNCPGQDPTSPFFATLKDSKQWLDATGTALPNHSQFKCFDGWAMLNQIQPAPYDGLYKFPSETAFDPVTGKGTGTNCTVCVPNHAVPTTDPDYGQPMLPAGKYVVEAVTPQGFEIVKEEDKNILLGDVFIAPVTQQFAGFGNIFIMPDQASVNAYYNQNNPGNLNLTTSLGAVPRHEGDTGSVEAFWPCVGDKRIVPDLISLYPGAQQAAPFAGASRNLCDRKEVTLEDQDSALVKFYDFTSTHIAGHFTGTITNDFASEFDPFSPQFGEKFGPPNLPVALRDYYGNEVGRVHSDQWGVYDGLYFSTWTVNPPNPTGYAPQMAIFCMDDPGPILDTTVGSPTYGQMITDPGYNPAYSNFCYETPFMPGQTSYLDTPVIPTQGFADGYNLPDSEYPDGTPAIKDAVTSDLQGPWLSSTGTLTLDALGDMVVQNPNFAGPNANTAPYNQKTITRHYGFGTQCTARGTGCAAVSHVTIGGVRVPAANISTWNDGQITLSLDSTLVGQLPLCSASNASYTGANASARCGEVVIVAGNGKRSVDAITLTVGGTAPWVVTPSGVTAPAGKSAQNYAADFGRQDGNPLQEALDSADPGDLILVEPGTYRENLIMWKPVRLQGVGAASVTINADAHPSGKMDPWRRQIDCLFGLTIDGAPYYPTGGIAGAAMQFDPAGQYHCPDSMYFRADRLPFEGFVGWDAASNGNLAQVLQEPTLMGAYEGAGVTVVGRGIRVLSGATDLWGQPQQGGAGAGTYPNGSQWLTNGPADCASTTAQTAFDYGTANYQCNPSRIDGLTITNSSQGGGGIFMHAWAHYMEVSNTRIFGNEGTYSGGINLGNGETPTLYSNDGTICGAGVVAPAPLCPPFGSNSLIGPLAVSTNAAIPFQLNVHVHVHHNMIIDNASTGDALFSGTPAGSGGVTISSGADYYRLDHNWIAGNLSTGDGGGVAHDGLSFHGRIAHNVVIFNQSTNPTLPTDGGGIVIMGAQQDRTLTTGPNAGQECGTSTDVDCPPGIGDGTGKGLVINANLIMGNSAESGSGGGLRIQQANGADVSAFPNTPSEWYNVRVKNNVIANNVAGWDGGGVSLQDALKVTLVNNTIVSNDTTATAGVLFKTLGAINAAAPPPGCVPTPDPTMPQNPDCLVPNAPHNAQPSGVVTMRHTPNLIEVMGSATCPTGSSSFPYNYTGNNCRTVSLPRLANDMIWQNRSFRVDIVGPGSNLQSQQNLIALTPQLNQASTGQCNAAGIDVLGQPASVLYWDVGVRGDLSPTDHSGESGALMTLRNSILTSLGTDYTGNGNIAPGASPVNAQYCNGARVPPEACMAQAGLQVDPANCHGYNAPAGRSETTGLSTVFVFNNITPAATVDEGHNWLNLTYGPLTLMTPTSYAARASSPAELMVAAPAAGYPGGAYSISGTSAAANVGDSTLAPARDFFGHARPAGSADIGAVEHH